MRTYLISLTAAVCLTQLTSNPPKNIHGTVYDAINKKPLAGITVKLDGAPITAYTDSRGYYEISRKANSQRVIFLAYNH